MGLNTVPDVEETEPCVYKTLENSEPSTPEEVIAGVEIDDSVIYTESVVEEKPVESEVKEEEPTKVAYKSALSNRKEVDLSTLLDKAVYVIPCSNFEKMLFEEKIDVSVVNELTNMEIEVTRNTLESDDNVRGIDWFPVDEINQTPTYGGKALVMKDRALKVGTGNINSVEVARVKALSALGLSSRVSVPLYNSGFWITLEAMGDKEFLDLDYSLSEETLPLGRRTNGAVYGNDAIIYDEAILEFIEDKLLYSSLDVPLHEVCDHIKATDFDIIATMLMHNFFKTGFELRIPCMGALEVVDGKPKCSKIYDFNITPRLLINPIGERLTVKQTRLMSNESPNSVTLADVDEYLIDGEVDKTSTIVVPIGNGNITILFRSPSVKDKVTTGREWINMVMMYVNDIITSDDVSKEAKVASKYAAVSKLNTYIHFIDTITYPDGAVVSWENKEVMMETLSSLSGGTDEFVLMVIEGLLKYILATTKYVIGFPTFKCPTCATENVSEGSHDHTKDIIPLDVLKVFSQLATLKREKMTS